MRSRILKWGFLCLFLFAGSACKGETKCEGADCPGVEEPFDELQNAKQFLTTFNGKRASENYTIFLNKARYEDRSRRDGHYCEALYGAMLGDVQQVVSRLNATLALVVQQVFAPPLAGSPGEPGFQPMDSDADAAFDYGELFRNAYGSIEPLLVNISQYANAVTTYEGRIPECGFSIGVDGDEASDQEKWIYPLNFGDDHQPILQLQLQGRMDGAEARVLNAFVRSVRGVADFILAHDMSLELDLMKIGHMFGLDQGCLRENGLDCFENFEIEPRDFRGWSFLFEDNQDFLSKHIREDAPSRWDRMGRIDNLMAPAFFSMRSFFSTLSARDRDARESRAALADDYLSEFFIIYRDENEDGVVDQGDFVGINIKDVACDTTTMVRLTGLEEEAEALCEGVDIATTLLLPTLAALGGPPPVVIDEVNEFMDRAYANMRAVEEPTFPYQRIPINSFDETVRYLFQLELFDQNTPTWLEFDVAAYFDDPKPLRDFIPLWETDAEIYPHGTTRTTPGSRFIMDSDDYHVYYNDEWTYMTLPVLMLDLGATEAYIKPEDTQERALFPGRPYQMDPDCLNMDLMIHIFDEPWPVMAFALPDPTFNGALYVNLGVWSSFYPRTDAYNGVDCSGDDELVALAASNYSLTKGMWLYVAHLYDSFVLGDMLP